MAKKKSHLDSKWYVVGQPWGNGTYIIAGHPDPYLGIFVADCEYMFDFPFERYEEEWDLVGPCTLAQRIVADHNEMLSKKGAN